jgi:outer membrane protein assembly factor BamB
MRRVFRGVGIAGFVVMAGAWLQAQGREWTTAAFDAQRTGWVRTDARLTKDAIQKGAFQFLWKARFENETRQLNSLTPPIILDRLIGYRGFKALGFVGGSADRVFAIDTDLARPYWTTHLNYSAATGGQPPSSWECPGGLIATPTRRTVLAPQPPPTGGGGARGGRSGSAVGEPGRGAAVLSQPAAGRGRRGAPAGPPPAPVGGRAVAAIPFGGVDPLYAVGSDGFLHTLSSANGADMSPAVPFVPPSAKPSALIFIDGIVYTTTSGGCGAAPNAVWAIDLTADNKVTSWKTGGPDILGSTALAFGSDGTLYVALGEAASGAATTTHANAVVALDRATLEPKDWFTAGNVEFSGAPIVFPYKNRDVVAISGSDGRLYVLDGTRLGGADHKTPLHVTARFAAAGNPAGLSSWEAQGTRWILVPVTGALQAGAGFTANGVAPAGSVVAFKVADAGDSITLTPGWASRNLTSPLAPIVVNGVVFAVSSGEHRGTGASLSAAQRAQRSIPAVLYALDGATGQQLWSSRTTITSFARGGLSAAAGQVYLVTYDNHLYAFGIPMEH